MRSGLTQKVWFDKGEKVVRDKTFWEEFSGQLPDLGLRGRQGGVRATTRALTAEAPASSRARAAALKEAPLVITSSISTT